MDRLLIASKVIRNRMKIQLHPNAVIRTKVDGMVQEESTQNLTKPRYDLYRVVYLVGALGYGDIHDVWL